MGDFGGTRPLYSTRLLGRPLPGSIVGTGSLRGAQTERRTPDPTVVGPILQAARVAPQREVGPPRGFPAGEGDRPREGRDRGEAAELGAPQVRESPAHQEREAGA